MELKSIKKERNQINSVVNPFRIKSGPELGSQINDRNSFQSFLDLSAKESSPAHSTFSNFRKRLSKGKFDLIVIESNWTVKRDKAYLGLKEHAAVDAKYGFVFSTVLSKASVNDTNYLINLLEIF